ncbi:PssE/Cps14G family polysaccharide biosynthesis glycosyltransferase [Heyndrickxia coagulans]|uniref:Glycosyltransferase 28 domain-containing protein n=1 Tax=Heyndrickxia coagulans 36D1 TaxID=345219 RepID=G2TR18_HEYCO|nr:PssE/Cps14G family polysaccharide biosynthesis glycosyltransferase [Heyndrickxia coagulans]AEP00094.1 Glycosyltransferase 28 domain-containing protein [Heyndrickxia coagulans 36D1]
MIFVTVGTQRFQFNRLFKELDRLVENNYIKDKIIAQIGYSDYIPQNFQSYKMISQEKISRLMQKCDLLITHGGTSSIIQGLKLDKPVVTVPRLKEFNEHIDDHQIEICKVFESKNYITVSWEIEHLFDKINESKNFKKEQYFSEPTLLINDIKKFINQEK